MGWRGYQQTSFLSKGKRDQETQTTVQEKEKIKRKLKAKSVQNQRQQACGRITREEKNHFRGRGASDYIFIISLFPFLPPPPPLTGLYIKMHRVHRTWGLRQGVADVL